MSTKEPPEPIPTDLKLEQLIGESIFELFETYYERLEGKLYGNATWDVLCPTAATLTLAHELAYLRIKLRRNDDG